MDMEWWYPIVAFYGIILAFCLVCGVILFIGYIIISIHLVIIFGIQSLYHGLKHGIWQFPYGK